MKRLLAISLALVLALSLSIGPLPVQPALAGGVFKVPSNYSTIQAGINAASTAGGGTVLVAAGTYNENIELEDGVCLFRCHAACPRLPAMSCAYDISISTSSATPASKV